MEVDRSQQYIINVYNSDEPFLKGCYSQSYCTHYKFLFFFHVVCAVVKVKRGYPKVCILPQVLFS